MGDSAGVQALLDELTASMGEFAAASAREDEARSGRIKALNRMNAAQKKFDAYVHEMKKSAHRDSDWGRPALNVNVVA